jgi:hypothetical protein
VRAPAQLFVPDVLLPDQMRVMSTCRDVEEQFKPQPRNGAKGAESRG